MFKEYIKVSFITYSLLLYFIQLPSCAIITLKELYEHIRITTKRETDSWRIKGI